MGAAAASLILSGCGYSGLIMAHLDFLFPGFPAAALVRRVGLHDCRLPTTQVLMEEEETDHFKLMDAVDALRAWI